MIEKKPAKEHEPALKPVPCESCGSFLIRIIGLVEGLVICQCESCGFVGKLILNEIPIISREQKAGGSYLG